MNKTIIFAFLLILSLNLTAKESSTKTIHSVSDFVSVEVGKELIVQDDDYSRALSKFDLELRVHGAEPTLENLNTFTQNQVLEWTDREKVLLDSLTKVISDRAIEYNYKFKLPEKIAFIKTTMEENKGAGGYTRLNYIVLSAKVTGMHLDDMKNVISHELFHVISRYNPKLRTKLYSVIGFTTCNQIEINTELKNFTISNPDAPKYDAYIELKDSLGKNFYAAMVLYSKEKYQGGAMFDYMNVGFLKLNKGKDGTMSMYLENGKETILNLTNVTDFFEQIGSNTKYIIHPEEIIASNFELLFDELPMVNNTELLSNIEEALTKEY